MLTSFHTPMVMHAEDAQALPSLLGQGIEQIILARGSDSHAAWIQHTSKRVLLGVVQMQN